MNELINFAKAFVFCSFAVLLIHIIAPKGSTEKILTLVLCAFTLLSIADPIKKIKNIIPDINESYYENDEYNDNSFYSVYNTEIRMLTDEALNSIEIDNYELIINTNENEGTLVIEDFRLYVNDISRKEEIMDAVNEKTGLLPEIYEMDGLE